MTQISRNNTQPLHTGPLHRAAGSSAGAATTAGRAGTDSLAVSRAATAHLSGASSFPKKYTGLALYGTDQSTGGDDTQINRALGSFVADFKKLSPTQQEALLNDPKFSITVQGHASNLGMATSFNNQLLSEHRGENTAAYVEKYLSDHGVHVPAGKIHSKGNGNPGNPPKAIANNDQADRSASLEIDVPAVKAEPAHTAPAAPPPAKPASAAAPAPANAPANAAAPQAPAAAPTNPPIVPQSSAAQPAILPAVLAVLNLLSNSSSSTTASSTPYTVPTGSAGNWKAPTTDNTWQAPTPFTGPTIGPGFKAPTSG